MPGTIPQALKAQSSIDAQPNTMTSRIQKILNLDIAGVTGGDIAKLINMTQSRVSIIRHTPFYEEAKRLRWEELRSSVIDKESDLITNEEIRTKAREASMTMLDRMIDIGADSENEYAAISAAKEVHRIGKVVDEKKTGVSIEIGEKWAERWDGVLGEKTPPTERKFKIKLTEE